MLRPSLKSLVISHENVRVSAVPMNLHDNDFTMCLLDNFTKIYFL